MNEQIDLEELERKVYRSYFQDGLWDFFMGWLILGMGLSSFATEMDVPEIINIFVMLIMWNMAAIVILGVGKKRITLPRLGIVKFGPKRQADKKKLYIFLWIMVGVNLIVLMMSSAGFLPAFPFQGLILPLILGLAFISTPFFIIAYYIDFNRLYYYGLIMGFSLFLIDIIYPLFGSPVDAIIIYCSMGSPIVIFGIVLFVRFIKKYPKPTQVRGDIEKEDK